MKGLTGYLLIVVFVIGCSSGGTSNEIDSFESSIADNQQSGLVNTEDISLTAADQSLPSDTRWLLRSYQSGNNDPILAVAEFPFTFSFTSDEENNQFGYIGFDGCSVFGAEIVLSEGSIVIPVNGPSVDNFGICTGFSSAYDNQFDFFYNFLSDSFTYQTINSQLVLSTQTGLSLTFDVCIPEDPESLESICLPNSEVDLGVQNDLIWSSSSNAAQLYLLYPGQFGTIEPTEPVSRIYSENISTELDMFLGELRSAIPTEGPFPDCLAEPGIQFFYLIVEQENGDRQRFAQEDGCGRGYGFDNPRNFFFEQPIEGVITLVDFCNIAEFVGVSSLSCE